MGIVLSVVSGKGGTGKTSLSAGIATCLAAEGQRVLCIDADVGLRNLDISLGMIQEPPMPFSSVMDGSYGLDAAARHPAIPNLFLLTAPVTVSPDALDATQFGTLLDAARSEFDVCLIDSPAGVGAGFRLAVRFADQALVVSCGDPASLRDASRAAELLQQNSHAEGKLIVNRISRRLFSNMRATVDDVMDGVGLPLLGLVPEDVSVTLAAAAGVPLVLYTRTGAAEACLHLARRICGKKTPLLRIR